jgi:hypothetical protein
MPNSTFVLSKLLADSGGGAFAGNISFILHSEFCFEVFLGQCAVTVHTATVYRVLLCIK